jgi:hypothetical protein
VAAPPIATVLDDIAPQDAGAASGVLLTATQIANALGVTALGAVFSAILGASPDAGAQVAGRNGRLHAFGSLLVMMAALDLLTAVAALLLSGPQCDHKSE